MQLQAHSQRQETKQLLYLHHRDIDIALLSLSVWWHSEVRLLMGLRVGCIFPLLEKTGCFLILVCF